MVVDGGQVEGETDLEVALGAQLTHVLLDLVQAVHFLLVRQEHVRVYLVDEDLILNVFIECRAGLDHIPKLVTVVLIVLWLGVYHIDQGATVLDGLHV